MQEIAIVRRGELHTMPPHTSARRKTDGKDQPERNEKNRAIQTKPERPANRKGMNFGASTEGIRASCVCMLTRRTIARRTTPLKKMPSQREGGCRRSARPRLPEALAAKLAPDTSYHFPQRNLSTRPDSMGPGKRSLSGHAEDFRAESDAWRATDRFPILNTQHKRDSSVSEDERAAPHPRALPIGRATHSTPQKTRDKQACWASADTSRGLPTCHMRP